MGSLASHPSRNLPPPPSRYPRQSGNATGQEVTLLVCPNCHARYADTDPAQAADTYRCARCATPLERHVQQPDRMRDLLARVFGFTVIAYFVAVAGVCGAWAMYGLHVLLTNLAHR